MEFIDLKKQYQLYKNEMDAAIHEVLDTCRFVMGPKVTELEEKLAEYAGVKHCLAVSSGTDALLIALMALGIGPGDEVITTPFTWISTQEMICLLGATPIFVDIDPRTLNMNPKLIEGAITSRTKAILPVCIFGQMANMDAINTVANKYQLPVVEDAAQSFGATHNGKKSCGASTIGCTSFFPAKPFGCYGDGGGIFTNDTDLADKMRAVRTHGDIKRYEHRCIGINGRLDTIQAAILLVKLRHFDNEIKARQRIGARYNELFDGHCTTLKIEEGNTSIFAVYTILVDNRDEVEQRLKAKGIPSGVYYPKPGYTYPAYKYLKVEKGHCPVTEKICDQVLSLPMHPWLSQADQDLVVETVKEVALV